MCVLRCIKMCCMYVCTICLEKYKELFGAIFNLQFTTGDFSWLYIVYLYMHIYVCVWYACTCASLVNQQIRCFFSQSETIVNYISSVSQGSSKNVASPHLHLLLVKQCSVFPMQCSREDQMCSKDDWRPLAVKYMRTDTGVPERFPLYVQLSVLVTVTIHS